MLFIRNISVQDYKNRQLIDDLSFTVNKKDKIALIGEEGNGKSTLLKLIYDESLVKQYCDYKGSIDKQDLRLGYLPQMLEDAWKTQSIIDYLLKENPNDDIDFANYNILEQYYQLCAKIQLDTDLLERDQLMDSFSGGEKMKIQLLKLLFKQPDILLLDEPTNDLDIDTLEWLEEFLLGSEIPVLFISHDETLLERVANGIVHLEQLEKKKACKHTVVRMGYQEYVEQRYYLIDRQNMIASKEKSLQEKQMEKWRQIYQKVDHAQATISRQDPHGGQLLKSKMKAVKSMKRRIDHTEITRKIEPEEALSLFFSDTPALHPGKIIMNLELESLEVAGHKLAQNIDLVVKGQDKVVIVGSNGSGKTTLLKVVLEELKKQSDIVLGYMPQNYEEVLDVTMTPIEFLAPSRNKEDITEARNHLGSAKFTVDEMEHTIFDLSGGQKAKLILIFLILQKANVLVLDEPTRNLSPLSNPVIRKMLQEFSGAIISVSHDRRYMEEVVDTVYELTQDGLVVMKRID